MRHSTKQGKALEMVRNRDAIQVSADRGWVTYQVIARLEGEKAGQLTFSWIPDFDERYAALDAYRKAFGEERSEQDLARTRAFHSVPFVAYVSVEEEMQRQGIGVALYREAAAWLAEEWGLPLRSGDLNAFSYEMWKHLIRIGEPVTETDVGRRYPDFKLDYRTP